MITLSSSQQHMETQATHSMDGIQKLWAG